MKSEFKLLALLIVAVLSSPGAFQPNKAFYASGITAPKNIRNAAIQYTPDEIYKAVSGGRPYKVHGNVASFEQDGVEWTVVGANAPIINPTIRPEYWPVKGNSFEVLVIPEPITNYKILPWTDTIKNAVKSDRITIQACPGEYEPASFVIRSGNSEINQMAISVTNLIGNGVASGHTVSSKNIDIRIVKCWYQAGEGLWLGGGMKKVLSPELLLHDDNFIRVNHRYQVNLIRGGETFYGSWESPVSKSRFATLGLEDSTSFLPFQLPRNENRQIWLTLFVPQNTVSGVYVGEVLIRDSNSELTQKIDLILEVLPISLESPVADYAVYYRGKLALNDLLPWIGSEYKTRDQMSQELRDIREHGFTHATMYQPFDDLNKSYQIQLIKDNLDIRTKSNFSYDPLLYLGYPRSKFKGNLADIQDELSFLFAFFRNNELSDVFIYGIDEAKGNVLRSQVPIFKMIRSLGGKIFVAVSKGYFEITGDLIDLPIYYEIPEKALIERVHSNGYKIWIYHYPQGGEEKPLKYRRNYGIDLWLAGLDGMCLYAYQHAFGKIWDDFDHESYRDHAMTYPTIDGFVPTIQWEGMREAVDDVRYLNTYLNELDRLQNQPQKMELLNRHRRWLQKGLKTKDLYFLRKQLIEKIIELKEMPL